jgi:hypothetical protein
VAFNQTFSNPTAGSSSAATWDWSFPAQPSNLKMLRINESPDVSLNPAGLGTQFCSPTAWPTLTSPFDPSLCPPGAKIGSFTIKSPSYSAPATGDVYIIAPTGSLGLPKIGVDVRPTTAPGNPAGVNVNFGFTMSLPQQDPTCDVATDPNGFCQQIYSFLGRGLPDVSISQAKLTFTNQIFTVGGAGCQSPIFTSVAMFTPISGSSSSIVDADPISGC